jgi:predicted house-cleaning noncanonical NTP pyrophosphatase (MazG superfamily)
MTLTQALWEIVRDENIIITNQNIDWLLDRALKKASGDAQTLKESILERKEILDEKFPTNENKSNNFDVKSNKELFKQALVEGLNRRFDREIEEAKEIEQIEEMAQFMAVISHLECGRKPCEECKWCGCERIEEADCTDYLIAEHLYNAGYRKYPCSIGDTVYCIWQYSDFAKTDPPFILEDKVIGFVIDEGIIKPIPHHYHQYPDWYTLRDIKFTQEEAEKALAKMKGGE